ncbi:MULTISPECIES: putative lipid II flippase FtsW [Alkalimonas]|uniref:Probable peptidoglycan glycosyltransferase FtsW n=1 Tax=Alkalimonas mucilaginosa TaxID=3057676 RepID=A0ABU7JDA4_9GAMM|nr:putative lipid II flippase FtsW [Alkalimonas sp. MEB004]MEE2023140.1 putative lipid II flippase FtsW [Alkalimonas sp. MEB004]
MKALTLPLWPKLQSMLLGQDEPRDYDSFYLMLLLVLLAIGVVMVTSASVPVAERLFGNPMHFTYRHLIFLGIGTAMAVAVLNVPVHWWHQSNLLLLALAVAGLVAVLLFGRTVNGATRWLALGPIGIQAAEPAKLFFFVYLASYLVRRHEEVRDNLKGFGKPMLVLLVLSVLLLLQPDMGTVIVMFATALVLLFLAGAKLWQFIVLMLTGGCAVLVLIVYSEYRWRRVTAFLDPWADPFGSGYQLTQSLMAFGRGGFSGQGLGNSIQKLEYLPEAHNDFIFAIIAEEIGFLGVFAVLGLLFLLVARTLWIGRQAMLKQLHFHGFLALALAIWFGFQTAVNIGVASGVLPTKGLTLPFVSSGGSSLIIMLMAAALVLRIDFEVRMEGKQAINRGGRSG